MVTLVYYHANHIILAVNVKNMILYPKNMVTLLYYQIKNIYILT